MEAPNAGPSTASPGPRSTISTAVSWASALWLANKANADATDIAYTFRTDCVTRLCMLLSLFLFTLITRWGESLLSLSPKQSVARLLISRGSWDALGRSRPMKLGICRVPQERLGPYRKVCYFPIQKLEKISPSRSSLVIAPVSSLSADWAERNSSAASSSALTWRSWARASRT